MGAFGLRRPWDCYRVSDRSSGVPATHLQDAALPHLTAVLPTAWDPHSLSPWAGPMLHHTLQCTWLAWKSLLSQTATIHVYYTRHWGTTPLQSARWQGKPAVASLWSGADCCLPWRPVGMLNSPLDKANLRASLWLAALACLPFRGVPALLAWLISAHIPPHPMITGCCHSLFSLEMS